MQVDYIIVGFGLAGLAFAETLKKHQKTFVVFNDDSQKSSLVAAGGYNPVILKRFSPVWDAVNQLEKALPFYKNLENTLHKKYDYKIDIHRIVSSVEEQNDWIIKSDKPVLSSYMQPTVIKNENIAIKAPFGFGVLQDVGRIDTVNLLADYQELLLKESRLIKATFEHNEISFLNDGVTYKDIKAKRIVFCEGFGLKKNPFFNELPLNGTKGEVLTIKSPDLKLDCMLKSSIFVMPIGNDLYKVGATFNWNDKTSLPTEAGKQELLTKLDAVIDVKYEVVAHVAGIRPTVKDRRPLLGIHNEYAQMGILNGLGTRGVMLAPKMAKILFNFLEKGEKIPEEVNINRFL